MTFNSTVLSVEQLKRAGFVERRFVRPRPGMERNRIVMLPKAIDAMLDAATPQFPRPWANVALDSFRAGHLVTISRAPTAKVDFKLLENVDEVWAFAIRKPRDFQARLLGRFVQKDIFVGIMFTLRATLAHAPQYQAAAENVAKEWDTLTNGVRPLRSALNADYLGHVIRDLDNE